MKSDGNIDFLQSYCNAARTMKIVLLKGNERTQEKQPSPKITLDPSVTTRSIQTSRLDGTLKHGNVFADMSTVLGTVAYETRSSSMFMDTSMI